MDYLKLQKGMTVKIRLFGGRLKEAEYIGRWSESFVFRYKDSELCSLFTREEVRDEVRESQ